MGKRSEVIFGNRMSSQVVKKAENSKERFVRRFGDDSDADHPLQTIWGISRTGWISIPIVRPRAARS